MATPARSSVRSSDRYRALLALGYEPEVARRIEELEHRENDVLDQVEGVPSSRRDALQDELDAVQAELARLSKRYLTAKEVAEILHVHYRTVRRMCDRGELRGAIRVGRDWRIPPSALKPEATEA